MLNHLGGFESTHIFNSGQDILGTTRHIEFWQNDLSLLLESGIRTLRYSIPWHRIERKPGEFDWTWMDGPMRFMRERWLGAHRRPASPYVIPDMADRRVPEP